MHLSSSFNENLLNQIDKLTCLVETPAGKGTGVIIKFKDDEDSIYLITAKHCILGKKLDKKIDIKNTIIHIPNNGTFKKIALSERDNIICSEENMDLAIIIIDKETHNNELEERKEAKILNQSYTNFNCKFRGYPQVLGTLEAKNINVIFTDFNQLETLTPLSTIHNDPKYNCEGFSGSGVFFPIEDELYMIGIIYELKEAFQSFKMQNLYPINELLKKLDIPELTFSEIPKDTSILKDIEILKSTSNRYIKRINDKIGNKYHIHRISSIESFKQRFNETQFIVITGIAGVGKSVFAHEYISTREKENYQVFAFSAESFAIDSIDNFNTELNNKFEDIFDHIQTNKKVIILIDRLEKILDIKSDDCIRDFFNICNERKNIKVIITCRKYAYNQILYNYSNYFSSYDSFEVPLLNDVELDAVKEAFPELKQLSQNQSIQKILKCPFYLNIVTSHIEILKGKKSITEKELIFLIWDKAISKDNIQRGSAFERIALERARKMELFVRITDLDTNLIEDLYRDDIIIKGTLGESYSPSHDIFEDIALIRVIERNYQETKVPKLFFKSIGKEPAIRRGFRLWMGISLNQINYNLNKFINDVISNKDIEYYWENETLIAILKSEYCSTFFSENEQLILADNAKLLMRFISLLKTACVDVTFCKPFNNQIKSGTNNYPENKNHIVPLGKGWETVIKFIHNHIDKLEDYKFQIIAFLVFSWNKKLENTDQLPYEAQLVVDILFCFINKYKNSYKIDYKNKKIEKILNYNIELLFKLAGTYKAEIKSLLLEANENLFNRDIDYNLRDFYRAVINRALSYFHSKELCQFLPNEIYLLAKDNWIYQPPQINSIFNKTDWEEEAFGISNKFDFDNFPESPYRTPLLHLLNHHTENGLKLIVDIMNHSTEKYINSDRYKNPVNLDNLLQGDNAKEIKTITANEIDISLNGKTYKEYGNEVLWCMYRGTCESTPYLLQSLLMALEKWLLNLAETNDEESHNLLEKSYLYLLSNSTSVATTSILVSVALAYPQTIGLLIMPVLKVKEFYSWDIVRMIHDRNPLAPMDIKHPIIQKERVESNNLQHRKLYLENLVTKLQTCGFYKEINEVLDKHINKLDPTDTTWQLMLGRMDFRKYEVDKVINEGDKQYVSFKVNYPDNLQKTIEENVIEQVKMNTLSSISLWSHKIYENPDNEDNSYENWQSYFDSHNQIKEQCSGFTKTLADPTLLAAIGIRDYNNSLTEKQKEWCISLILDNIKTQIEKEISNDYFSMKGTIYIRDSLKILPSILNLQITENTESVVKELIFLSLAELDKHHKESIIFSVRENLWKIDPDFALSCFSGLISYSVIQKEQRNFRFSGESEDDYKKRQKKVIEEKQLVINRVINCSISHDFKKISFSTHSIWHLITALQIIPHDTTNHILKKYYKAYLSLILTQFNEEKPDQHFDLYYPFYNNLAFFLLKQNIELSKEILDSILLFNKTSKSHHAYSLIEFQENVVNQLFTVYDTELINQYWDIIQYLSDNLDKYPQREMLLKSIFLNMKYLNPECIDWKPLKNKKDFYKKQIEKWGSEDLESVAMLLSGLGSTSLLPEGIIWFTKAFSSNVNSFYKLQQGLTIYYCEKMVERVYCNDFRTIKSNKELKLNMLKLLDLLIMFESSIAYNIRERLISI